MDAKDQRRKRNTDQRNKIDRYRYSLMTNEEKQEKLKKRREAYHQRKKNKGVSTDDQ
jgi:hypothetical protein